MVQPSPIAPDACFNPSQVGYKLVSPVAVWRAACVFQSLTGRLQTRNLALAPRTQHKFQSLTGRLQTIVMYIYQKLKSEFQSLTGRLQTGFDICCDVFVFGFNPSQVGYKPRWRWNTQAGQERFNPSQVGYKPSLPTSLQHWN